MENLTETKFYSLILGIFILMLLCGFPRVSARFPENLTAIIEDGYIYDQGAPGPYLKRNTQVYVSVGAWLGDPDYDHGYVEYNVSSLDDTAIIEQVQLVYMLRDKGTNNFTINDMQFQPSVSSNFTIFGDAANGTQYNVGWNKLAKDVWHTISLTGAETDLQNNLGVDWFAIGLEPAGIGQIDQMFSEEGGNASYLIITWHLPTDEKYVFNGPYYENGNVTTPITITASLDSGTEEYLINGSTTLYFPSDPNAFYWDIGGGFSRFIYGVGNETNMITLPDDLDYTYQFDIKDLTGNVGTDSFLEAYRIINGSETLVTRMPIEQPNDVPMNLVFGKTYRMKIRFGNGAIYDWGFFIPGNDLTITLLVRLVEFGDGAQVLYNHITVDAVRTTGLITMDYLDDRNNTVWANVSIRIRNGAVVQTYERTNASYTINYAGFNDSLGYIVTFTGYHDDFGVWGRTFILDESFTFPDAPNLDGVFGSVMQNFVPFILTCITILVFPVSMQPIGLLAGGVMASMLSFFNWASWSYEILAFYWFIAILVNLVVRGRGT